MKIIELQQGTKSVRLFQQSAFFVGRISLGRCETAANVLSTDRQAIRIQKTGQAWSRRTLLHSSICQKTQLKSNNPLHQPLLMALAVRRNCQCIQAEFWQQFILSRPESTPYYRANTNYSTRCFLPSTVLYHIFSFCRVCEEALPLTYVCPERRGAPLSAGSAKLPKRTSHSKSHTVLQTFCLELRAVPARGRNHGKVEASLHRSSFEDRLDRLDLFCAAMDACAN